MVAKDTKAKKPAAHPTYKAMVKTAIAELKERNGCSRAKILNYIKANFEVSSLATNSTRNAIQSMLTVGEITNVLEDKGLNGRFKLPAAAKKPKAAAKTTSAKKPKAAAKTTSAKKPKAAAKTTVANKPAAKKAVKAKTAPKKKASPKKKTAAKKPTVKKASPKKKSVKKVTKTPTKKAVAKPKKAKKSPKKAAPKKKPAKK